MPQLPVYGYVLGFIYQFLVHATVGLPEEAVWLPGVILLILGAAATVDAFTEVIPDSIIFLGLLAVTVSQGLYVSWLFAAQHVGIAFVAGLVVVVLNELGRKISGDHIFYTGDIKWTVLAVSCFDAEPVLLAWGVALCLGIVKVMIHRIFAKPLAYLYLAPYLFPGLLGALYVLRVSHHNGDVLLQMLKKLFL